MDQTYVYDETAEDGLTLKKLGRFFKRGWLWMLICIAAAVVLTTIIALPIKIYYKSEPVVTAYVEYVYDGVEKGEDPNGGLLNPDDMISMTVLDAAVKSANLDTVVTDISALRELMRVEPVISESYKKLVQSAADGDESAKNQLAALTYFPTRYDIILSKPKEIGLSDSQAKQLVDKIMDEYFKSFMQKFSQSQKFAADVYGLSSNDLWEFTRIYDEYELSLDLVSKKIKEMASTAPKFSSTVSGASFSQLVSELSMLELDYDSFNDFILGHNVWRSKNTAYINLRDARKQLSDEIKSQKQLAESYGKQIEAIKPNVVTVTAAGGVTTTTETYPQEYYDYQARLAAINEKVTTLEAQLAKTERRINAVTDGADPGPLPEGDSPDVGELTPTPADDIATASSTLRALEERSAAFVNKVNATVSDYYGTVYLSSSVRKVLPSTAMTKSADFELWVIYVVAALVGLVVGCVVTGVLTAKSAKKQAAVAESNATAEENGESTVADTDEKENNSDKARKK